MKVSKLMGLALVVGSMMTAGEAKAVPDMTTLKLNFSCKMYRRYLDKNDRVAVENLTPANEVPKVMTIGDTSSPSGTIPSTNISFTVMSPDGPLVLRASASAYDMFKQIVQFTIFHSVNIESKEVNVNTSLAGDPHFKYDDPQASFASHKTTNFTVGVTSAGYAKNDYYATCEISPEKPVKP